MKKRYLLVATILIGLGISWWLFGSHSQKIPQSPTESPLADPHKSNETTSSGSKTNLQPVATPNASAPANVTADVLEFVRKTRIDPSYEWRQPINFYGRVVDESNAVVIGANVHFEWNDLSEKGTSEADAKSDSNGTFSLIDRRGKYLFITVGKEGYYSAGNSKGSGFEYANPADGLFTPNPNRPVVFHLRKKGPGVDLIVSQAHMSTFMRIVPPTNGSPVFLDFFSQQVGSAGQLKIEGWKENKDFKTAQNNWGFRLTVPDGGLIENIDEFPFEAPDGDYQSVVEWHFTDGTADWRGTLEKKYYIKFGNPPRYGRIAFDTGAFYPAVHLEYVINPDGSRNLEPK